MTQKDGCQKCDFTGFAYGKIPCVCVEASPPQKRPPDTKTYVATKGELVVTKTDAISIQEPDMVSIFDSREIDVFTRSEVKVGDYMFYDSFTNRCFAVKHNEAILKDWLFVGYALEAAQPDNSCRVRLPGVLE